MHHRRGLTTRLGGGGTVQIHGDSTASRTPVGNVRENDIDLEQQVLIIMIGGLLLKGRRATTNLLVMATRLDGTAQGPSKGTMLTLRQMRNISNRIGRITIW